MTLPTFVGIDVVEKVLTIEEKFLAVGTLRMGNWSLLQFVAVEVGVGVEVRTGFVGEGTEAYFAWVDFIHDATTTMTALSAGQFPLVTLSGLFIYTQYY